MKNHNPLNEIVYLTKKLIEYKTVTKNFEENRRALFYIKKYLDNNALFFKFYKSHNFDSLLISNVNIKKHAKNFDLILHGHIDVVEGKSKDFLPIIKNNKIYGRGALDMKGGLSTLIYLMKNLKNINKNNKKILLIITSDEEIGGENGTGYLLKKVGFRSQFFITAEGEKNYLFKIKQKGVLMFKIYSHTKGDHSAYVWNSENAILKIFDFYKKAKKLFKEKKDKNHWHTTINLGTINGGKSTNSIANYCEATFDVRFCEPWKDPIQIVKKLEKITKELNLKIKVLYKTNLSYNDTNNFYIKLLHKIAKKILNKKGGLFFNNHGTNDARFASAIGIPAIAFGPIGNNYHTDDEYVEIESLEKYYLILEEFIKNI